MKAMIVERATRSEALRGVKVAVYEVDLLDEAGNVLALTLTLLTQTLTLTVILTLTLP